MRRTHQHGGMELSDALHAVRSLPLSIACSMPTLQSDPNSQCTLVVWHLRGKMENPAGQRFREFLRRTNQATPGAFMEPYLGVRGAWMPPGVSRGVPRHRVGYITAPLD
eukprot:7634223-Pyramimonas_sp.AAC.1